MTTVNVPCLLLFVVLSKKIDFNQLPPQFQEAHDAIVEFTEALTAVTLIERQSDFRTDSLFSILYTRSRIQKILVDIGEVAENSEFNEAVTTAYIELRTRLSGLDTLLDINSYKIPPQAMILQRQQQFSDLSEIPYGHWWWKIHFNAAEELKAIDAMVGKVALIVLAGNGALFLVAIDNLILLSNSFWFFRPAPIFIPAAASSPALASLSKQGKLVLNYLGRILEIPTRFRPLFLLIMVIVWGGLLWSLLLFTPIPAQFVFNEAYSSHLEGRLEEALEQYQAAASLDEDLSVAWLGSCLVHLEFNDLEKAASDCEQAKRRGSISAYHVAAWIKIAQQDYQAAVKIARSGLRVIDVLSDDQISEQAYQIDLIFLHKNLAIAGFLCDNCVGGGCPAMAYYSISRAVILAETFDAESSPVSLKGIRWVLLGWQATICDKLHACDSCEIPGDIFGTYDSCESIWQSACLALQEQDGLRQRVPYTGLFSLTESRSLLVQILRAGCEKNAAGD